MKNALRTLAVSTTATGFGLPAAFMVCGATDTTLLGTLAALGAVIGLVSGIIAGALGSGRIETYGYYTRKYGSK